MTRETEIWFLRVAFWGCLLMAALSVMGCTKKELPPVNSTMPVCRALLDPIRYNTYKRDSRRYAGPGLAPDLKKHNQVGQRLHCRAYR
jgi:hypothetical protein